MDVLDRAQQATEHFNQLALNANRHKTAPRPALRTDSQGLALCVDCDINITKRRQYVEDAQRCAECQHDHDRSSK